MDGVTLLQICGRWILHITYEAAIICNLYQGIKNLLEAEANASKTAPIKNTKAVAATTSHSNSSSSKKNHGDSFLTLPALMIGSAALWVYLVSRHYS